MFKGHVPQVSSIYFQGPRAICSRASCHIFKGLVPYVSRASCHMFKGLVPYVQGLRAIMFQGLRAIMFQGLIATSLCHGNRPRAFMS
ncbi:unnamed protein product [Camellia sinensis]